MNDTIEFTHRERFLLSYFRDARLSSWRRRLLLDGSVIGISMIFLVLYFSRDDTGYGVVAYGLLLWRKCASLWRARDYTSDYKSIFAKYDAKIEEPRLHMCNQLIPRLNRALPAGLRR